MSDQFQYDEFVNGAIGEAVKDAYVALKKRVALWAGSDVDALEHAPSSAARRAVVAEIVDSHPQEDQESARDLAKALIAAINESKSGMPIGIDAEIIEALRILLGEIIVTEEGTGIHANRITAQDIDIESIKVGKRLGKEERWQVTPRLLSQQGCDRANSKLGRI